MFPSEIHVVSIPIKNNFRGLKVREIALFEGSQGWSEFSPFLEYNDMESALWLKAAIEAASKPWPKPIRELVEINATLPNVPVNEVSALLENFKGCSTIKVKVNDFVNDHLILQEVLRLIPDAKIRLDVNGKWNLGSAIENLRNFEREFPNQIDYIEQPCSDVGDIASLRKESGLKIAVDESIRKNLGGELEKLQEVADVAIIKWAPTGGISAALEVIEKVNLPVVISSALDSSVGISHGLALAMATPNLYGACGLGTVGLLEGDVTSQPLLPENGFLSPRRINPDLLDRYRAKTERQKWWQDRVNKISSGGLN